MLARTATAAKTVERQLRWASQRKAAAKQLHQRWRMLTLQAKMRKVQALQHCQEGPASVVAAPPALAGVNAAGGGDAELTSAEISALAEVQQQVSSLAASSPTRKAVKGDPSSPATSAPHHDLQAEMKARLKTLRNLMPKARQLFEADADGSDKQELPAETAETYSIQHANVTSLNKNVINKFLNSDSSLVLVPEHEPYDSKFRSLLPEIRSLGWGVYFTACTDNGPRSKSGGVCIIPGLATELE